MAIDYLKSNYTQEFYKKYDEYLYEPSVRKAHNWIFDILRYNNCFDHVIDLGCGVGEFKKYFRPKSYMGVDINMDALNVKKADYRNCDLRNLMGTFKPMAFVSLFSLEITAPVSENYIFYENMFKNHNSLKYGLTSGFYYASKKQANIVQETGGITSHQTLESIDSVISNIFSESRVILPVPSKLFGEDVFEVWKILERRK